MTEPSAEPSATARRRAPWFAARFAALGGGIAILAVLAGIYGMERWRSNPAAASGAAVACAQAVAAFPQTVAIGVNCTHPALIPALIAELCEASSKPIAVYPNSGEGWDADHRCWTGSSDPEAYGIKAAEWFAAGAQMIGGCCRTRPVHIRQVAEQILTGLFQTLGRNLAEQHAHGMKKVVAVDDVSRFHRFRCQKDLPRS